MDNRRILIANVAPPDFGYRRVLIANLAKGQIGEQASNLLGSLLLSHLQLITMARSDQAPEKRAPFFVHVDEFQNFSTDAFASLLSEARKFKTHFCIANQYLDQVSPSIRAAVLGNAGTLRAGSGNLHRTISGVSA
jgi:tRNA isopentenyl-2-thiomethyl-A-37 hydroxylase MiaE